jgi:hypothetical protein
MFARRWNQQRIRGLAGKHTWIARISPGAPSEVEAQFGSVLGIAGAAALYGLYHVGYGMGSDELIFLDRGRRLRRRFRARPQCAGPVATADSTRLLLQRRRHRRHRPAMGLHRRVRRCVRTDVGRAMASPSAHVQAPRSERRRHNPQVGTIALSAGHRLSLCVAAAGLAFGLPAGN